MLRIPVLLFITLLISSCTSGGKKRLTRQELAAFLGPDSHTTLRWSLTNGPDFTVFHGESKPPLAEGAGFYTGMQPSFAPEEGSTTHQGQLGQYKVVWHRKPREDGSLYQTALISIRDEPSIHVWVYGPTESDLDDLIQQLSTLPIFSQRTS